MTDEKETDDGEELGLGMLLLNLMYFVTAAAGADYLLYEAIVEFNATTEVISIWMYILGICVSLIAIPVTLFVNQFAIALFLMLLIHPFSYKQEIAGESNA